MRELARTLSLGLLRSLAVRGGRSPENPGIGSFELLKHFGAVLRVHQVLGLQFDLLEELLLQGPLNLDQDRLLEDVVPERVRGQLLHDRPQAPSLVTRVPAEQLDKRHVVVGVVALEDGGDLDVRLLALQAFLDDVGGELEFAQSDEVAGNESKNLPFRLVVSNFQNVLHEIVAVGVFDQ